MRHPLFTALHITHSTYGYGYMIKSRIIHYTETKPCTVLHGAEEDASQ